MDRHHGECSTVLVSVQSLSCRQLQNGEVEYSVTIAKLNCTEKSLRCYSELQIALFKETNVTYMKQQEEELRVKLLVINSKSKNEPSVQEDEPEPKRKDLHNTETISFRHVLKAI